MLGQSKFAPIVPAIHAPDLRHRNMRFIGKDDGIIWNIFKQGGGRLARGAACQIARIVLNPVADARGLKHFDIEICALFKALCLKQFPVSHKLIQALAQFFFDGLHRLLHGWAWGDVMRIGVDADFVEFIGALTRQRIKFGDAFEFLTKKRETPCPIFEVRGPNL